MDSTILTVEKDDIARLGAQEAVKFFRELLWSEAMRVGIPLSKIQVTTNVSVPDGGIDASIDASAPPSLPSFLDTGVNSFQIKSGESFKPWQESVLKDELFGAKEVLKSNLAPAVRDVLETSGKYTLLCTKHELTGLQRKDALGLLASHLEMCGYKNLKVDVLDCSHLIGFLNHFPSLSLRLNKRAAARFQTHSNWSNDSEMMKPFFPGDEHDGRKRKISSGAHLESDALEFLRSF